MSIRERINMASVYERLKDLQIGELVKMAISNAAELPWIEERNRDNSAGIHADLLLLKPALRRLASRPPDPYASVLHAKATDVQSPARYPSSWEAVDSLKQAPQRATTARGGFV
jgi:hypothetical protein